MNWIKHTHSLRDCGRGCGLNPAIAQTSVYMASVCAIAEFARRQPTYPQLWTARDALLPISGTLENMEKQVFRRWQLPAPLNTSERKLRRAVEQGVLVRLKHRWYAAAQTDRLAVTAANSGMLIGCCTAAREWGLWVPFEKTPHFIGDRKSCQQAIAGAIIHRALDGYGRLGVHYPPCKAPHIVCSLIEALEQIVHYHDAETGLIVLESALNQRKIDLVTADQIINSAQKRKQPILRRRISTAQSGSETRVRNFLQSLGVMVHAQKVIPGVGRVDLLVGRSLVIECDSTTFHSEPLNVNEDRRRDAQQVQLGYTVVRLSYHQVWLDWEATQAYIQAVLHTHNHLKPPRPLRMPINRRGFR
ncbi:hypothetical protein [Arcanobacterium phocae]|uniref:hypothetical protein n=1 Tax=Arcanobacterium phocae TaxID=131112 RepID=UPI001C0F09C8|nr:hypothetical protein [Arcanobacterium phocae]